jgi:hypothetical protein
VIECSMDNPPQIALLFLLSFAKIPVLQLV